MVTVESIYSVHLNSSILMFHFVTALFRKNLRIHTHQRQRNFKSKPDFIYIRSSQGLKFLILKRKALHQMSAVAKFGSLESTVILFRVSKLHSPQRCANRYPPPPPQSSACFRSVVVITSASHAEGRRFKSCRKQIALLKNLYLKPDGHN